MFHRRRSFLRFLTAIPFALDTACSLPPAVVLADVVAGVEQASVILAQIESQLVNWPGADAALRAKIQNAINIARGSLESIVALGNVVTDVTDQRFQAALADFSTAFAAVIALAGDIGVVVKGSAAHAALVKAPRAGALVLDEPILLRLKGARR